MNVYYISILLFALPLNICVSSPYKKPHITPHHTPKIPTTRLLCECELYTPNYDKDPEMKAVMENFDRQTSQRFHEYDDRMIEKRKHCKDKCDKEIQKIILKDKLEKQMAQQFATLQTDIQSGELPECTCKKSMVDKMEKDCLLCGGVLGAGIAPTVGLIGGLAVSQLTKAATAAATKYATKKGIEAGVNAVIETIIKRQPIFTMYFNGKWSKYITESYYSTVDGLFKAVTNAINSTGKTCEAKTLDNFVCSALSKGEETFGPYVTAGKQATATTTATVQKAKLGEVTTQSTQLYGAIGYSILAILIIILIMVIIYLILRHRRKKKMKKKLQYIKLLEE
ncbi:rifin [Plasmodium reichenowi]|uniref:Rifin n=1 Tax=Plasmodium reichenowi TaxID=5854 RepID=A0A060RM03_PLARE|nr:rifin [Plasmodium reichenowi]